MRRALAVAALLLAGCATVPHDALEMRPAQAKAPPRMLARLGGPDASEPIAAYGGFVPESWSRAMLAAGFPKSPFGGGSAGGSPFSSTIISSVASGSNAIQLTSGAKLCMNATCTVYLQDAVGSLTINAATNVQLLQDFIIGVGDFKTTGAIGTAGSGTGISTNASGVLRTVVSKITVARTALTAAATTQDVTVWTVPAKARLIRMIADGTVAFTGGGVTALTITCGKTAGGNEYLLSGSLFTTGTFGDVVGEMGASLSGGVGDVASWSATTALQCRFTSTTANLNALTTGSVTFYLEWIVYP